MMTEYVHTWSMTGRRKRLIALMAGAAFLATPAFAFQQAPVLDQLVEAGTLPPVEERLPENPLVVDPVESVGKYGGTWRSSLRGGGDNPWIARITAYDGLVRYDRNWDQIIPNLAVSWEVSEDSREYTFTLRKDLKWSSGTPFTSADIEFAIKLMQDDEYPAVGSWMNDAKNPVTIEVVDDQVFKLHFEQPNVLLMDDLASVNGLTIVSLSKQYCSQFHPDYNPDAAALAAQNGYQNWGFMMQDKCAWGVETQRWGNPDLPFMNAWVVTQPLSGSASRVGFERNPYYWKVDPEGNQLPYIDTLDLRVSESAEEIVLLGLNGELDYQDRHINTLANRPIFFDGQDKGGYHIGEEVLSDAVTMAVLLNFNHVDQAKRDLFQNKDFRIGLSYAIDRQEIIDVVYTGQGEPFQMAPRPESPFYDEEMAKQYTEYDPDQAVKYLEAAGLTQKDSSGMRLMPDGSPFTLNIEVIAALRPDLVDALGLMQLQLERVGIRLEIVSLDRTLFYEKRAAGDYDAQVAGGDGGLNVIEEPRNYFPANPESAWAFRWQAWYNGTMPEIAEEPADWAKQQMELYSKLRQTADLEGRRDLMRQILAITKEQFPVIGVSLQPNAYYIARNNLKNVAPEMKSSWLYPTPGPYDPQQWYFE